VSLSPWVGWECHRGKLSLGPLVSPPEDSDLQRSPRTKSTFEGLNPFSSSPWHAAVSLLPSPKPQTTCHTFPILGITSALSFAPFSSIFRTPPFANKKAKTRRRSSIKAPAKKAEHRAKVGIPRAGQDGLQCVVGFGKAFWKGAMGDH
jgi:hypothetical protein